MKRVKKPKRKQISISTSELDRIKREISASTTEKAVLLILAATADVKGLTDDEAVEIWNTANRYGEYIDKHLVKLSNLQQTIEKATGIKLRGWNE